MARPEKQRPYVRGGPGAPAVLVAAGALGLWLLWPRVGRPVERVRGVPAPRAAYVHVTGAEFQHMNPALFGLPSEVGFHATNRGGRLALEVFGPRVEREPHYLPAPRAVLPDLAAAEWAGAAGRATNELAAGRAAGGARRVFTESVAGGLRVSVEPMGALRRRGFAVPGFTLAELKAFDKPRRVLLQVSTDAEGRADQVFLVAACDTPEINRLALRQVERGRLAAAGEPCHGLVAVDISSR